MILLADGFTGTKYRRWLATGWKLHAVAGLTSTGRVPSAAVSTWWPSGPLRPRNDLDSTVDTVVKTRRSEMGCGRVVRISSARWLRPAFCALTVTYSSLRRSAGR